jgi:hypothetical protein
MRRRSFSRTPALLLTLAGAFAAGALSHHLLPRNAHADAPTTTSSVLVPWEGLVFRTPDGTAIARLSRDAHGGLFELYGDRQEGVARFPSTPMAAPHPPSREPYVLDDDDPWRSRASGKSSRSEVGF